MSQSVSMNSQQQSSYNGIFNMYPNGFMASNQSTVPANYLQQQHQKQQQQQYNNYYNNNSKFNKSKQKPYYNNGNSNYNSNKNQNMYKYKANQHVSATTTTAISQPPKSTSLSPKLFNDNPNESGTSSPKDMFFLQIHDFKAGFNRNDLSKQLSDTSSMIEVAFYEKTPTNQLIKIEDFINEDLSLLNKNENVFVLLKFPNMDCLNSCYNLFNANDVYPNDQIKNEVDVGETDGMDLNDRNADNSKTFFKLKYFTHNGCFL